MLDSQVLEEHVKGHTPDISPYVQFTFYEPIYFMMPMGKFPFEKKLLGCWLGISEMCHDVMAFKILTSTGKVITCKDIWALSKEKMQTTPIQVQLSELDAQIHQKIGDSLEDSDVNPALLSSFLDALEDLLSTDGDTTDPMDGEET